MYVFAHSSFNGLSKEAANERRRNMTAEVRDGTGVTCFTNPGYELAYLQAGVMNAMMMLGQLQ